MRYQTNRADAWEISDRICEECCEPLLRRRNGFAAELVGVIIGAEVEDGRMIFPGRAYHVRCVPKTDQPS